MKSRYYRPSRQNVADFIRSVRGRYQKALNDLKVSKGSTREFEYYILTISLALEVDSAVRWLTNKVLLEWFSQRVQKARTVLK